MPHWHWGPDNPPCPFRTKRECEADLARFRREQRAASLAREEQRKREAEEARIRAFVEYERKEEQRVAEVLAWHERAA